MAMFNDRDSTHWKFLTPKLDYATAGSCNKLQTKFVKYHIKQSFIVSQTVKFEIRYQAG